MEALAGVEVRLTPAEMYVASQLGVRRHLAALELRFKDRNGATSLTPEQAYFAHINGAQGECAAAKVLGVYWPMSINARKTEPDLAPDWQVRTRARHDYDLIVREDDSDFHRYVLVTGVGPDFTVHGHLLGALAKRPEWLRDRGARGCPAYWVPKHALQPV